MATEELPAKYKACVYDQPGTVSTKVVELDLPKPGPGQLLVKLTHSGVCHSDYSVMTNSWAPLPPTASNTVGGHEGVGIVVGLGPGVAESSTVSLGDRVGIKWVADICGTCPACLTGHDAQCVKMLISGHNVPGTFQQYALAPANYATPIPDGLDGAHVAPMLCGGVTAYSSLRKCGAAPGNWVAVFGAGGGLGHLAVQMGSRGMGFRVVGIDHSSKRDLVLESGAEAFVAFDEVADVVAEVKKICDGLGAHSSINYTASNAVYATAFQVLRFGGQLTCVGIPDGEMKAIAAVLPAVMVFQAMTVRGTAVGSRQDAIEALDMMKRGIVKMHCHEVPMSELSSVFQDMNDGKLKGRMVLDLWK